MKDLILIVSLPLALSFEWIQDPGPAASFLLVDLICWHK